jgi:hypothetical protein
MRRVEGVFFFSSSSHDPLQRSQPRVPNQNPVLIKHPGEISTAKNNHYFNTSMKRTIAPCRRKVTTTQTVMLNAPPHHHVLGLMLTALATIRLANCQVLGFRVPWERWLKKA